MKRQTHTGLNSNMKKIKVFIEKKYKIMKSNSIKCGENLSTRCKNTPHLHKNQVKKHQKV